MLPKRLSWLRGLRKTKASATPEAPPRPSSTPAPTIMLYGTTTRMQTALGGHPWPASHFPFRIGRSSSNADEGPPCDLCVSDVEPYQVSRRHCALVWSDGAQGFVVSDAHSKLGTLVNGVSIGGGRPRTAEALRRGDNELILGGPNSPYRLKIVVP